MKKVLFYNIFYLHTNRQREINDEVTPKTMKEWNKLYPPLEKMKLFKFEGKIEKELDDHLDLDFKKLHVYINVQNIAYESTLHSVQPTTIKNDEYIFKKLLKFFYWCNNHIVDINKH